MALLARRRLVALLLLTLALAGGLVGMNIRATFPKAPPKRAVQPKAPSHQALTRQLMLVIVDGLRYDFATNAAVMPHFAEAMRTHSSGMMMAGTVTMTSSAVLAYTTGQPGDLDQIINNERAQPTPYNHWLQNAHDAGLVLAATGDGAWFRFHPGVWTYKHPDPTNVALHVDYNDEIFDAAREFLVEEPRPHFLVAHFVTPDHMAHHYDAISPQYDEHIRGFDVKLHQFLSEVAKDVTVIVTSDHGANDRGTHGSDSPLMRRCPFYAYGPGIVSSLHPNEPLDQLDLADTMAYLLGVAPPAHGEGHILARWIDQPKEQQAAAACESLSRLERYTHAISNNGTTAVAEHACNGSSDAGATISAARLGSGELVEVARNAAFAQSSGKWLFFGGFGLVAWILALAWSSTPLREAAKRSALSVLLALAVLVVALLLTRHLENLPGRLSAIVPGVLMGIVNAALLVALLLLPKTARLFERHAPAAATLVVGLLLASYTSYTRVQAYIVVAVTAVLLLQPWLRHRLGITPDAGKLPGSAGRLRALLTIALVVTLWKATAGRGGILPDSLTHRDLTQAVVIALCVAAFTLDRVVRRSMVARSLGRALGPRERAASIVIALAVPVLSWFRHAAPNQVGTALWIAFPIGALLAWRSGLRTLAEMSALACFALVARGPELVLLMATWLVAEAVGDTAGAAARKRTSPAPRHATVLALAAFLFCLMYIQRIGVQSGVDFVSLDWTAGTFDANKLSYATIGLALGTKHVIARVAVLVAVLVPLPREHRAAVVRVTLMMELARSVALTSMLLYCRNSFWTAMRVMSDVPHALIGVAVTAAAATIVLWRSPRTVGS